MSAIGSINLLIEETAETVGIFGPVSEYSKSEREAVGRVLMDAIMSGSCEQDCPHVQALGVLGFTR